jgi:hypothetical protein
MSKKVALSLKPENHKIFTPCHSNWSPSMFLTATKDDKGSSPAWSSPSEFTDVWLRRAVGGFSPWKTRGKWMPMWMDPLGLWWSNGPRHFRCGTSGIQWDVDNEWNLKHRTRFLEGHANGFKCPSRKPTVSKSYLKMNEWTSVAILRGSLVTNSFTHQEYIRVWWVFSGLGFQP